VLANEEVHGQITIDADNVTIRNVKVVSDGWRGIYSPNGNTGLTISNSEVAGVDKDGTDGINVENAVIRNVNIHGFEDGLKLGSNCVLENSWIHDLMAKGKAHSDGVQVMDGSNITIAGNRFDGIGNQNSAVLLMPDMDPISRVLVADNYLDGGNYNVYSVHGPHGGPPTQVAVRDNVFGPMHQYGTTDYEGSVDSQGNRLANGTPAN
jgi:hypothetical protein